MRRALSFLACLAAAPVLADAGPSFDCAAASGSAEDLICADADLAATDRRLAERYAAALAAVRGLDVGGAEAEDRLRATQRGWIKGRDDCWRADELRVCVEEAYLRREGDLVARWLLEQPTGTTFWDCEGGAEVVTMYFDTPLPSVRFEVGDTVDTGSQVRTASGARYDGSFGRWLWIKGNTATYHAPDPDGTSFDCTARD